MCNFVYRTVTQGMSRVERLEFDALLTGPDGKAKAQDQINAESMAQLGVGMIGPPPRRRVTN